MESLHNKIMNIVASKVPKDSKLAIVYKEGHRDARHEAAEMALEYESLIEDLVGALKWYVENTEGTNRYVEDEEKKAVRLINKVKND